MAKRYQGVRAGQILNILRGLAEKTQLQKSSSNSYIPEQLLPEKKTKASTNDCLRPKKRCKITKSYSLSNIPKSNHLMIQRRCSSVPPTITVHYRKQNGFDIYSDICSVDRGRSVSMSALTCDDTKESGRKRCSSVPPSYFSNNENTAFIEPEPFNLIDETSSYDGDYSGDDTDVTYCPSDTDQASSNSSSQLLLDEPSTSSGIYHGNTNEGRKRQIKGDSNNWRKIKNKKLRMLGQEYLGYSKPKNGKLKQDRVRTARQLGDRCYSQFCRKSKVRNCEKFDHERRYEIHNSFWKNMNWDQRKVYVTGLVTRLQNHIFECLGSYTVQSWVKKSRNRVIPCQEVQNLARVKTPRSGTLRKILTAHSFLDNIPKLPSHYARKDSSKLYLEPIYRSLNDLYRQYKEHCTQNEEPVLSRFTFQKLFHDKNLSLYTLKKDMCDICSGHAVGNINTADYEQHIRRKNRARQEKETDKKKATSGEFILLSMDLESVKVCPYLTASALYFKTKLTCHNFTIYDLVTHQASCYWFDETCADLTASTFTSFVCDYLERYCLPKRLPIVIYSDGCTYQNRNNIMANALLNMSIEHEVSITQKYLEPGHTQMECDSTHAAIERKLKNREIHLPSDYITVTKEARINPAPYEAIMIYYDFVKDYSNKSTWRYSSIRPGRKAGDPLVVDLRVIQYRPEGTIFFKINFDDDWSELPVRPRKLNSIQYTPLHAAPIPIASSKFNHLQQLKEVLPRDCHLFYDTLPHE
ncbi:unnamed protein product [Parnassius mnemosyne]|uniref:Integrase catalytic domain-containing protein n=1 Tax=Parnassius mnemosyne TaxID=213953 RepID=A0AAV1LDE9_9NEOP